MGIFELWLEDGSILEVRSKTEDGTKTVILEVGHYPYLYKMTVAEARALSEALSNATIDFKD